MLTGILALFFLLRIANILHYYAPGNQHVCLTYVKHDWIYINFPQIISSPELPQFTLLTLGQSRINCVFSDSFNQQYIENHQLCLHF